MVPLTENLVACPECDLLQRIPAIPPGGAARCPRCGYTIAVDKPDSLERTLSLTIAAAIVFLVANVWPLMGLSAVGRHASTTILGGAQEMWLQGNEITAVLVAFCTVIAPAVHIGFMLTVLLAVRRPPAPSWVGMLLRRLDWQYPWAMIEVMMLGILVALIKIAELATVITGIGMYAVGALMALFAAMKVSFNPREVWTRIRWVNGQLPPSARSPEPALSPEVRP
ncbi:MAG TPA: paraquat-inducible protein A [Bacteroidota bacterium]|nr:paraquat-inducible protein A [Bacteroidota bacterium]